MVVLYMNYGIGFFNKAYFNRVAVPWVIGSHSCYVNGVWAIGVATV